MSETISDLTGQDLKGFQIIEMTEVYRVDGDGRKTNSLGFFRKPTIAKAFAGYQSDANYHKTQPALILTNGKTGYVIADQGPVKLFDDEQEALALKEKALQKLSTEDKELLGIGENE